MSRSRRYPSDLSDLEWAVIEPLLPAKKKDGRPEIHPRRDIVDAILYVTHNGGGWRALPVDFPPWRTVYEYFRSWEKNGVTKRLHDALRDQARAADGRAAAPTAGVIDSQSVKAAPTVAQDSRGYDAGKKINGRKRFIVTDTLGLLLTVLVVPASAQDRQGARQLLIDHYFDHARCRHLFADGAFSGAFVTWAKEIMKTTIEIVKKKPGQKGFEPLPRRWVVERTFGWTTANRRLARDYERTPAHSESFIRWAMIRVMTRRLARGTPALRWRTRPTKDQP
jgi:putative transposase